MKTNLIWGRLVTDEELEDYARQMNEPRQKELETQRRIFARLFAQIGQSGSNRRLAAGK